MLACRAAKVWMRKRKATKHVVATFQRVLDAGSTPAASTYKTLTFIFITA